MLYEDLQLVYFPIFLSPDGTAPLQGLQTFPSPTQLSKRNFIHIHTYMHAHLHRCDIFDLFMFTSFGNKSIFYTDWDLGGDTITEVVRLGQALLMTWWRAGISKSNLQLSSDTPALDNMALLEITVFAGPLGSEAFDAAEQQSRPLSLFSVATSPLTQGCCTALNKQKVPWD